MSFGKLFSVALESVENEGLVGETTVVEPTDEEMQSATGLVETSFKDSELAYESIDEAILNVSTLMQAAESIENIHASGGMDENMAKIANISIEMLYERLAVKRKPLIAMETYANTETRKGATALAVEDIKETAQKVWQAILKMLKQAYEFVKNFFKAAFDKNTKISNAAKAKLESLKKFKEDNKVDDSITSEKIVNPMVGDALRIDGKVDFSTIKEGFDAIEVFLSAAKTTTVGLKAHLNKIGNFKKVASEEEINKNFAILDVEEFKWERTEDNGKVGYLFSGYKKFGFGDKSLIMWKQSNENEFDVSIRNKISNSVEELSVLSLDEIEKALDMTIATSAEIDKSKSVIEELENIQKTLEKEIDSLVSISGSGSVSKNLNVIKSIITSISKLSIRTNTVVSKYAISCSGHVLHYIDLCMKEHKIAMKEPVSA